MHVGVLGAGLMGRAIAFDLKDNSAFSTITLLDINKNNLEESACFFSNHSKITYQHQNVSDPSAMKSFCKKADIIISAVPYQFNESLTKLAISQKCHFIDLGGNNTIVDQQKKLFSQAKNAQITIIPDCGLAPGLVSILTRHLVEEYGHLAKVKLRVGGLPQKPQEPWKYQLVFSTNGLINEYTEDAIILDNGTIKTIPSLSKCESIEFPEPFGIMEAFTTSGGCSSLPFTYKNDIDYLDYKTIRYPGHLNQIKPLFDLGLDSIHKIKINGSMIKPRDLFIHLLNNTMPTKGRDVVLLKVIGEVSKEKRNEIITFQMIDFFDEKTSLSAMMRTTGFPVSITAYLIATDLITNSGVFTPEEIISPHIFLKELRKRKIDIKKTIEFN